MRFADKLKGTISAAGETDHTNPLQNIHEKHKSSRWLTDEDLKNAANQEYNFVETSHRINQ